MLILAISDPTPLELLKERQLQGNLTPFGWNSLWTLWGCWIGKSWSTAPPEPAAAFPQGRVFWSLEHPRERMMLKSNPQQRRQYNANPIMAQLPSRSFALCLSPAPGSNNQWESPLAETLSLKINYHCLTLALMNSGGWSNWWWTIFLAKELLCLKPLVTFVVLESAQLKLQLSVHPNKFQFKVEGCSLSPKKSDVAHQNWKVSMGLD